MLPAWPSAALHLGSAAVELPLYLVFVPGARRRAALPVLAVRRHRSS